MDLTKNVQNTANEIVDQSVNTVAGAAKTVLSAGFQLVGGALGLVGSVAGLALKTGTEIANKASAVATAVSTDQPNQDTPKFG